MLLCLLISNCVASPQPWPLEGLTSETNGMETQREEAKFVTVNLLVILIGVAGSSLVLFLVLRER